MKIKPLKLFSILTSFIYPFTVCGALSASAINSPISLGDVNGDSFVNAVDASCILSEYAGISTGKDPAFNDEQKIAADLNNDGIIDSIDASVVLAYYAYCSVKDSISVTEFLAQSKNSADLKHIEAAQVDISKLPSYTEKAFVTVNNNVPYFSPDSFDNRSFEYYSDLDDLGRCGVCMACIGKDTMPTEERGSIGMIKPTGWHLDKYDIIEGKYLYNRCHLIGYQLTAENANPKNLVTGTRYLNVIGMLPFENLTASYVNKTDNHVLYRVTPVFDGDDLLCRGVLMEGWSLEDNGVGVCFNVFCYNVQPGITIDYSNGDNCPAETAVTTAVTSTSSTTTTFTTTTVVKSSSTTIITTSTMPAYYDYIVNKKTKVFHYPSCSSVKAMNEENKWYYQGERDRLITDGYSSCKRCNS